VYEEIHPPTFALTATMMSTGHLPKSVDEMYGIERDGLWAIPTAEVPLTSMHADEILMRRVCRFDCAPRRRAFRREAARPVVTRVACCACTSSTRSNSSPNCTPEQGSAAFDDILARAESLLQELGLTYRLLNLCTGRSRDVVGAHDRPRSLQPRSGPLARSLFGELVPRLPGPSSTRALPHERRDDRAGAHRERLGAGWARVWAA